MVTRFEKRYLDLELHLHLSSCTQEQPVLSRIKLTDKFQVYFIVPYQMPLFVTLFEEQKL